MMRKSNRQLPEKTHQVDLCVVGGGLSGLCAAVAAARHGASVALMHDRPMLGGNASSEVRMHVCGAHGDDNRETGIVEEIELENFRRNAGACWSVWDSVLWQIACETPNLTLLLNCSCCDANMEERRIVSVRGWQTTSQTWHTVRAGLFADCSGDSILAPLTGAEVRWGREAESEFHEDIQPAEADGRTMGMSCLIEARETGRPQPFVPPDWAHTYRTEDDLPHRSHGFGTNFWWIEVGGEQDTIHDTEEIRDELLKIAFGVWDHVKNHCENREAAANWALDWVGFLPGKRESRRYVGDHILTQNDVRAEGRFDDVVAYGGWSMDDHHPAGIRHPGKPTIFHPAPSPYGIPYRCLYSRNVDNLFCAGRNISTTHAALSSTRVMATCGILGQATGTAAAIAVRCGVTPRGVWRDHVPALQQALLEDDCYLPGFVRDIPSLTAEAGLSASAGDPEPLRNGIDRPLAGDENAWQGVPGAWVEYRFPAPRRIAQARFVFDSDLNRSQKNMPSVFPLDPEPRGVPATLVKDFRVEVLDDRGRWQPPVRIEGNARRLVRVPLNAEAMAVRFVPETTWGSDAVRVFAFDLR